MVLGWRRWLPAGGFLLAALVAVALLGLLSTADRSSATYLDDLEWEMDVDPAQPRVGDTFTVEFSACCGQLNQFEGLLHMQQDGQIVQVLSFDGLLTWGFDALAPGTVDLYVTGRPHKNCNPPTTPSPPTPTPTPLACLDFVTSPTFQLTVSGDCGDVNGDGLPNSLDALLILQYDAGLLGSLPDAGAADANGDAQVTSIDAALVLQLNSGLLTDLVCA